MATYDEIGRALAKALKESGKDPGLGRGVLIVTLRDHLRDVSISGPYGDELYRGRMPEKDDA